MAVIQPPALSIGGSGDLAFAPLAQLKAMQVYGPEVQTRLARSQYLADALRQMYESGPRITGGWGELGAKLLASAILQRGYDKTQKDLMQAYAQDQQNFASQLLQPIVGGMGAEAPPPAGLPAAGPPPPAGPLSFDVNKLDLPAAMASGRTGPLDDTTRLNLARMDASEAANQPLEGQFGVLSVARNRARLTGNDINSELLAPRQFTGMRGKYLTMGPDQLGRQLAVVDQWQAQGYPDPTSGATFYYNPALASPSWGGPGQMIGAHNFRRLAYQGHDPSELGGQTANDAGGGVPITLVPPSGGGSSAAPGGPPGATTPQASAPGGAQAPWPTYKPTTEEVTNVAGLLSNWRTYDQGVAEAIKLRQKMAQPAEADTVMINGVPHFVPKDPRLAQYTRPVPYDPSVVSNRTMSAEQAGIPAAPGTTVNVSPFNVPSIVNKPPEGYQWPSAPGGGMGGAPGAGPGPGMGPGAGGVQLQPLTGGPVQAQREKDLRDEFTKAMDPYIGQREAYQRVKAAAETGTPAGDLALTFNLIRLLSPTARLAEGQLATLDNTSTIPERIRNTYNRLISGHGSLSPEERADFAQTAGRQFMVYDRAAQQTIDYYSGLAAQNQVRPEAVVRAYPPVEMYTPPGAGEPLAGAQAARWAQGRRSGEFNESAPLGSPQNPFRPANEATIRAYDQPQYRGLHLLLPNGHMAVIQ